MDFFAFMWLMSLTVLLPLGVVKLMMDFKRARLELKGQDAPTSNSLTTSELKAMIREAVEEVSAPLRDRIERLEEQRPAPLLGAALEDEPLEAPSPEAAPTARRRVT